MKSWNISPLRILRALFWLRVVSVLLQLSSIGLLVLIFPQLETVPPLLIAVVVLAVFNAAVHWRLTRAWPVTEVEVVGHLLFDVMQFSVVLFYTGGAANPFVSLFLLPVALAAASVRIPLAMVVGAACTLVYSALLIGHQSAMGTHYALGENFNLHLWGMWLNFLLAGVLLILFVGQLANLLRGHEREIATARERTLRDEGILALGTLAAGAAHQLGTPMSTMQVLVNDWIEQDADNIQREDLTILAQQVNACREILQQMLQQVREAKGEVGHQISAQRFIDDCIARWRVTRPEIQTSIDYPAAPAINTGRQVVADDTLNHAMIRYDVTLAQALTNLLNNAADASIANQARLVNVKAWLERDEIHCQIHDHGRGLSEQQAAAAQQMFHSRKSNGMGIGLALSNSTVERLQGSVSFHHDETGGITWVRVPLNALKTEQETSDAATDR